MSKRSSFERIDKDFYGTLDPKAIPTNFLLQIVGKKYAEPCYGDGDLVKLIGSSAECVWQSDIREDAPTLTKDALELTAEDLKQCDITITNPPFKKDMLLPLIDRLSSLKPTWLLLPSDLMFNAYMVPYMKRCERVISIGRLYWFVNEWVVKKPFDHDELDTKWDSQIEFYDSMKGIKYFTGYLTNQGKPCKTEFVRGTDNYAFYLFQNYECDTVYETRGDN